MLLQSGGTSTLRTYLSSALHPHPHPQPPPVVHLPTPTSRAFPRYSALKKHIYALEKQYAGLDIDGRADDLEALTNERTTLLGGGPGGVGGGGSGGPADAHAHAHPADDTFAALLDPELHKIVRFYREQEAELFRELQQLEADIAQRDAEGPGAVYPYDEFDEDDEDEENLSPTAGPPTLFFFVPFSFPWGCCIWFGGG
jgi:hypothetical protein